MTLSMDNFTPDRNFFVDIDPITWETVIYKYKEHNKQCIESFIDPDIKAEFRGFASHEFRVQPVYVHTRTVVHYRSYILEHQIADEEPTYFLLEVINNCARVSRSEDYKVLWNRAGRRKELVEKLSVWDQELPVELTFSYTDPWGGEVEEEWHFDEKLHGLFTFSCPTGSGIGEPKKLTLSLFNEYKKIW